jgi:hypothetical protein
LIYATKILIELQISKKEVKHQNKRTRREEGKEEMREINK